ncbi:MAG: LPS assembly lipoprotein LptE [Pseudomonadota bacterium]
MMRAYLFIPLMLLLASCGFQPVYGTVGRDAGGPSVEQQFADIRVAPIADREGQMLRNELIDQIYVDGIPQSANYELVVTLGFRQVAIDIDRDDSVTRSQLIGTAVANLMNRSTGERLWSTVSQAVTTFNVLDSPFATVVSERTAREQAIDQISDDLVVRLGAFLRINDLATRETADISDQAE